MISACQPERALHRQVADWLRLTMPWALWCHVPNEGQRDPRVGAHLRHLGMSAGVPDILIFEEWVDETSAPGRGFGLAIELKTMRGRLADEQDWWLQRLDDRGWLVSVCRTLEQVQDVAGKAVRR